MRLWVLALAGPRADYGLSRLGHVLPHPSAEELWHTDNYFQIELDLFSIRARAWRRPSDLAESSRTRARPARIFHSSNSFSLTDFTD